LAFATGLGVLALVTGSISGGCRQPESAIVTSEAPPQLEALPLNPVGALDLEPAEIAARLERSVEDLTPVLAGVDPYLGADAEADARRVQRLRQLIPRYHALVARLRQEADEKTGTLRDASLVQRLLGTQLFLDSERLDLLLAEWQRCEPRRLSVLLAALETLALELPLKSVVTEDRPPAVAYDFFPGHPPGTVPREAGWLVAVGTEPWAHGPAWVSIRTRSRRDPVATIPARRVANKDGLAVWLTPEFLADHAGDCLTMEIRFDRNPPPTKWPEAQSTPSASWPLCIPRFDTSAYQLAGYLEYRTPTRSRSLEPKAILFENGSCDRDETVSESLEWELLPRGRIVDSGDSTLFEFNSSDIDCVIDGNLVHCAGTLSPATCEPSEGGDLRVTRQTDWKHIFSPTEEILEEEEHLSHGLSLSVSAEAAAEPFCVELARDEASDQSRMRFELISTNGNQRRVFFASPTAKLKRTHTARYTIGTHQIDADFETVEESGAARVCVTLHSETCGF
jgi:hypothetical protein